MFWPAVAALSLALSGEHHMSSDVRPRGLMQYRPDTRVQCFQIITEKAFIDTDTQNITEFECLRIMTGLPQGPGKLWTKFCSGNSPNGLMTRPGPGPGPTSEKLTSELALVHRGSPGAQCCPAWADMGRALSLVHQYPDQIFRLYPAPF